MIPDEETDKKSNTGAIVGGAWVEGWVGGWAVGAGRLGPF